MGHLLRAMKKRRAPYRFSIITLFPDILDSYMHASILGRAQKEDAIEIRTLNPRDKAVDKHKTVDDTPYGGGPGMVLKAEPIVRTLKSIRRKKHSRVLLMSAKGKRFTQADAKRYAEKYDELIFICGRYEGVDERVVDYIDEEVSIGDFVLTGGELGAAVIVDSVARLVPGVLGDDASSVDESHTITGVLEYPQYTRPEIFDGKKVPAILLSGDHKKIAEWRKEQSKKQSKKAHS